MQAADLFEEGVIPAEIARRVGVRHQIVSQWRKAWRQDGRDALRSAVAAKFADGKLFVVSDFALKDAKTKGFRKTLDGLKIEKTALLVEGAENRNLELSSRNLKGVELIRGKRSAGGDHSTAQVDPHGRGNDRLLGGDHGADRRADPCMHVRHRGDMMMNDR